MGFLKRSFTWIFASVGFLTVLGLGVAVFVVVNYEPDPPTIPEKSVLWLDLNRPVAERPEQGFLGEGQGTVFRDMILAIDKAIDDPRIEGVAAQLGGSSLSIAQAQELSHALIELKTAGKSSVAFAEDLGSGWNGTVDYMLAASFGELWLQPSGGVGLSGLAIEMPFFRDALDEYGVSPQFEQRHEFKGGIDSYVETGMTPAMRASLSRLLESWTRQIGSVIVDAGRLQSNSDFLRVLNNGPYLAKDALALGLVDRLGYWDEAENAMNLAYPDVQEEDYLDPVTYLWALGAEEEEAPGKSIALIYGVGAILPDSGDSFFDDPGFQPYSVADALSDAREDESIAAVVFRVDSPGGAYGPSDSVWREMVRLRESGKPVIVSMGGAAASGGYFVSMNADQVFALPGTVTGSIGVYSGKFATAELWDRFGIRWERLQAGTNAGIWSSVTEFSRSERDKFREGVDFVYTDFTTKVAEARGFTDTELDAAARGRIWTGEDARDVGLVDELGGLLDAIEAARIAADLSRDGFSLRLLPEVPTAFDRLLEVLESGDPFGGVTALIMKEMVGPVVGAENLERLEILHAEGPSGILHMPPIRLAR